MNEEEILSRLEGLEKLLDLINTRSKAELSDFELCFSIQRGEIVKTETGKPLFYLHQSFSLQIGELRREFDDIYGNFEAYKYCRTHHSW